MPLKIVRNDIIMMDTEAIVNTANSKVAVGPGCDSAIYKAAGYEELLEYRREKVGVVPEGEAFITPGFRLKAEFVIHAVSPAFIDGNHGEEDKLRKCYQNCLRIANEHRISSIAFPLISTGGFGYPKEVGMRIAVDEINAFLLRNDMLVYLVVFDEKATRLGSKLYKDIDAYIDRNYVDSARKEEYDFAPRGSDRFTEAAPMMMRSLPMPPMPVQNAATKAVPKVTLKGANKAMPQAAPMAAPTVAPKAAPKSEQRATVHECSCQEDASFEFEEKHVKKLDERMKHISDTFSQYLMYLIQNKNMENAEVWKRAIVDKKIFSKIKNNANYHPQKLTALCLCVGARLNLDESKDLLARAGYALSPCDKTDIIFSYFIENGIYDMIELDIQLEEHGLPCIIE